MIIITTKRRTHIARLCWFVLQLCTLLLADIICEFVIGANRDDEDLTYHVAASKNVACDTKLSLHYCDTVLPRCRIGSGGRCRLAGE